MAKPGRFGAQIVCHEQQKRCFPTGSTIEIYGVNCAKNSRSTKNTSEIQGKDLDKHRFDRYQRNTIVIAIVHAGECNVGLGLQSGTYIVNGTSEKNMSIFTTFYD